MQNSELTRETVSAVEWRFVTVAVRFVVQFGVQLTLARLLAPEAFGVVAIALIFVGLAATISETGLSPAVVQRPVLTDRTVQISFSASMLLSAALAAALFVSAAPAAGFFHVPHAASAIRALSAVFVLQGTATVSTALLQRRLQLRKLFLVDMGSYVVGYAIVGVVLAAMGYGVWALVWACLVQTSVRSVLGFVFAPHPVRPTLRLGEARDMISFAAGSLVARCMNYGATNGDYFVVGRALGAADLGLYNRAYQLMTLPVGTIYSVFSFVLLASFSQVQEDDGRLRHAFRRSAAFSSAFVFPALGAMAVAAPQLIVGLYGKKWVGAVRPFQLLCVGGMFRTVNSLSDAVAKAKGAVYRQSVRHFVYALGIVVGSIVGSHWGIDGVAVGVVIALAVTYIVLSQLTVSLLGFSWRDFFASQFGGVLVTIPVVVTGLMCRSALATLGAPDLVSASVVLGASALVALGALALLPVRSTRFAAELMVGEARRLVSRRVAAAGTP